MKRFAWFAALAAACCMAAGNGGMAEDTKPIMTWPDLLERPRPAPDRTIAYGADPLQMVDLWLPAGKAPYPVVLMIHGGCWQTEVADRTIMNWIAADLRDRGIAVWNIDYRGVDRGGGYPGTFQDVAAAADLLARDGAGYGLKTDRIVAVGHSAGGHLALWLAARPSLPSASPLRGDRPAILAAAISQGGLPDLEFSSNAIGHGCGVEAPKAMAGQPSTARPDIYADTSPIAMKPGAARQLQVNATLDRIAPPDYAHAYAAAMARHGVSVRNVTVAGEGHVELITPDSRAWEETISLVRGELGI